MIIVYPMLVSRAVSENSIPGIAKTVENYIMVNLQDSVVSNSQYKRRKDVGWLGGMKMVAGRLWFGESEDITISEAGPPGTGPGTKNQKTTAALKQLYARLKKQEEDLKRREARVQKNYEDKMREADKKEIEAQKTLNQAEKIKLKGEAETLKQQAELEKQKLARDKLEHEKEKEIAKTAKEGKKEAEEKVKLALSAKADLKVSDMKSINLEPTWMEVTKTLENGATQKHFLGIKVIPFRVKSDVKLSHLILYDSKLNALTAITLSFGRKIMKRVWQLFDRWTGGFRLGGITPTGDPRRDVIMNRTGMGPNSETFIVLSKQEDIDDFFLDNIQRVNRLFKMGWGNFVIADDIGRTAWFCMEKFRGMCNAVPYTMMYKYLNQDQAYEKMEDVKKANSSIFKVSKKFSRILGEVKTERLIDKYSQLSEGKSDE